MPGLETIVFSAIALAVGLIVGAVVATLSVKSIAASYKRKNPSTSYPLDRYATLDLTRSHDRVLGKFVTTTIISSGGRGGRGGGGGGTVVVKDCGVISPKTGSSDIALVSIAALSAAGCGAASLVLLKSKSKK